MLYVASIVVRWIYILYYIILYYIDVCSLNRVCCSSEPDFSNTTFYKDMTLRNIRLVVLLGHNGTKCPAPSDIQTEFMVVDGSGLHVLNIQFCRCHHISSASYPHIQLLHVSWFPSSLHHPHLTFTFDVLNSFHLLTLQGKTSAYDFYTSISHKTDNTGVVKIKVNISFSCLYPNTNDCLV
jgi:hypothetical protein